MHGKLLCYAFFGQCEGKRIKGRLKMMSPLTEFCKALFLAIFFRGLSYT